MKTRKVLELCEGGSLITCVKMYEDEKTPFRVYRHDDRYSRKQIAKFSDFIQVLRFIYEYHLKGMDTLITADVVKYIKEEGLI